VISRFRAPNPQSGPADAASEQVVMEVAQPSYANHKAGMIAFGPDGMLYIATGDGGGGGDPLNAGQDLTTLLGKILRIDVRTPPVPGSGLNYVIPADNPFAASNPPVRREIWAYGFRNPYRFSFDRITGLLYAGDVGQGQWEEIDVVRRGGNYGWRLMEGNHCYNPPSNCDPGGLTRPIAEYAHEGGGGAVIGGYVYQGSVVPELAGVYLFADFVTKRIMGLRYDGLTASPIYNLAASTLTIGGFGQDSTGEVYLLEYVGGIHVLRPSTQPPPSTFPQQLSDLPALLAAGSGQGHTVDGVYPYAPSAQLWSDGASKERYFALPDYAHPAPDYAQMSYRRSNGWDFPEGTVAVKNFLLSLDLRDPEGTRKRIETRLLVKKNGAWHGFTYEWNDGETDARLLAGGKQRSFTIIDPSGQPFSYSWTYPTRGQCTQCHTAGSNFILGLNTAAMNHDFLYPASGVTDNQVRTLDWLRLFDPPLPAPPGLLPRMPDPSDVGAPLGDRARAYLAANCSMCHRPGGTAGTSLDFRWEVLNEELYAIGVNPSRGDLGIAGAKIIKAGDPDASVLVARMATLAPVHRMPPLATTRVDDEAAALLRNWIATLQDITLPQVATLLSPGGVLTDDNRPIYTWNKVANSSWYYLWINGPSGNVFRQWYYWTEVCGQTTCSATPAVPLVNGPHQWWIQTWNPLGHGAWTPAMDFTVNLPAPAPPPAATLIGPSGPVLTGALTFQWNVAGSGFNLATWYQLSVDRPGGNAFRRWYRAEQVCAGSTCGASPPDPLPNGGYTWSVVTWNAEGYGPASATLSISVEDPTPGPPPAPVLVSPSGDIVSSTPAFTWYTAGLAGTAATRYYLWVNGPANTPLFTNWYDASPVCAGATCSVTPSLTLANGQHKWWVQAANGAGSGPWSEGRSFNVRPRPPGAATLVAPSGDIATLNPVYTWNAVAGNGVDTGAATWYYLWVNGPAGQPIFRQWFTAPSVCSGAACSVTPGLVLGSGSHIWWIQTWNDAGYGPWSAGLGFGTP
jgi:uncharacterized repeat protein (TIGR03806 family)